MKAKSIKGANAEEIQTALQQSMADGFRPTLAIVFISIKQDRKAISSILNSKGIDIVGATSCGEFTEGHQTEGETAIMLLDIDKNDYCILFEDIGERSLTDAAATSGASRSGKI
ncbi:MAG: FIST N-terminal domain-containing protein [Nocardioidaceae bacterium]